MEYDKEIKEQAETYKEECYMNSTIEDMRHLIEIYESRDCSYANCNDCKLNERIHLYVNEYMDVCNSEIDEFISISICSMLSKISNMLPLQINI